MRVERITQISGGASQEPANIIQKDSGQAVSADGTFSPIYNLAFESASSRYIPSIVDSLITARNRISSFCPAGLLTP